jgi:hypothetical protein
VEQMPPRVGRVHTIALQVEALGSGRLRLSSPHARGWAATVTTPHELALAVQQAYTEVAVASYARARGEAYDLDALTTRVPGDALAEGKQGRKRTQRTVRRKSHNPADWSRMEDGRWLSPAGRAYREDSRVAQDVVARRKERGLPT